MGVTQAFKDNLADKNRDRYSPRARSDFTETYSHNSEQSRRRHSNERSYRLDRMPSIDNPSRPYDGLSSPPNTRHAFRPEGRVSDTSSSYREAREDRSRRSSPVSRSSPDYQRDRRDSPPPRYPHELRPHPRSSWDRQRSPPTYQRTHSNFPEPRHLSKERLQDLHQGRAAHESEYDSYRFANPIWKSPNIKSSANQQRTTSVNGVKNVPTGPSHAQPTIGFIGTPSTRTASYIPDGATDLSGREGPHIFIPASSVPIMFSTVRHLSNIFRGPRVREVYLNNSGYIINFEDSPEGRIDMEQRVQRLLEKPTFLFNKYKIIPDAFPCGLRPLETPEPGKLHGGKASSVSRTPSTNSFQAATPTTAARNDEEIDQQEQISSIKTGMLTQIITQMAQNDATQSSPLVSMRQDLDDSISTTSGATGSSTSRTKKCHICKMREEAEPLILCRSSSCHRRYHRHCYKEQVPEDLSHWQCRRCVKKGLPLKRPAPESSPLSATPSASIAGHESEHRAKRLCSRGSSPMRDDSEIIVAPHVGPQHSRLSLDGTGIDDITNRSGAISRDSPGRQDTNITGAVLGRDGHSAYVASKRKFKDPSRPEQRSDGAVVEKIAGHIAQSERDYVLENLKERQSSGNRENRSSVVSERNPGIPSEQAQANAMIRTTREQAATTVSSNRSISANLTLSRQEPPYTTWKTPGTIETERQRSSAASTPSRESSMTTTKKRMSKTAPSGPRVELCRQCKSLKVTRDSGSGIALCLECRKSNSRTENAAEESEKSSDTVKLSTNVDFAATKGPVDSIGPLEDPKPDAGQSKSNQKAADAVETMQQPQSRTDTPVNLAPELSVEKSAEDPPLQASSTVADSQETAKTSSQAAREPSPVVPESSDDENDDVEGPVHRRKRQLVRDPSQDAPKIGKDPVPSLEIEAGAKKVPVKRISQRRKPISKVDLGDSFGRPKWSYLRLIGMALLSTPDRRMQATNVPVWIHNNIPRYDMHEGKWRESLKATMNLNALGKYGTTLARRVPWVQGDGGTGTGDWYQLLPGLEVRLDRWDPVQKTLIHAPDPLPEIISINEGGGELNDEENQTPEDGAKRTKAPTARPGSPETMDIDDHAPGDVPSPEQHTDTGLSRADEPRPTLIVRLKVQKSALGEKSPRQNKQDPKEKPKDRENVSDRRSFEQELWTRTSSLPDRTRSLQKKPDISVKSLFDAWPQYRPFDEQAKIEEIKRRPTRKQLMGKSALHTRTGTTKTISFFKARARPQGESSAVHDDVANPQTWETDGTSVRRFTHTDDFLGLTENLVPVIIDNELCFKREADTGRRAKSVYHTGVL